MALRISGGDWSPWAGVAHQLVSERQAQEALDLRAEQLRAQREQAQASNYLRQLGLEQNQRQFDATMGLKEEQLGERYYRDALRAEQRAQDLQFRMEEAGFKRGLNEADRAVRMGAIYDTAKKAWRPITPDDELWGAHQEYVKNKRTNINRNVELNRRIRFIDNKIRNQEKQVQDLMTIRSNLLGKKNEDERAKIDGQIEKIQKSIANDRVIYNNLYSKFFKGYAAPEAPAPTPAPNPGMAPPGSGQPEQPSLWDAAVEGFMAGPGSLFTPSAPTREPGIAPQGAGQMTIEQMTEPLPGSPTADMEGSFNQADLERMGKPDTFVNGTPYFVATKYKPVVKRDLLRILTAMQKAQRAKDFKKLAKLNKERREYFKKHLKYMTQNPDR